ncbi:hypothetical protein NPIL_601201 [Nephila pilipes]|uniref:Mos1 transposase HTH domain-containing protein n=1 Tax=Nephila pilipes TaxID=299642 RepID=A0A8X6T298_NEPPI|nr:hypothetical protein NPIL_601201 [Nephila pilipes]
MVGVFGKPITFNLVAGRLFLVRVADSSNPCLSDSSEFQVAAFQGPALRDKMLCCAQETVTETVGMLREAYGNTIMTQNMFYRWHKMFREDIKDSDDKNHSGGPFNVTFKSKCKQVWVGDMLNSNRRLSVRTLAVACNIYKGAVHRIVTKDLNIIKICTKLVSKVPSDEQKAARTTIRVTS